MNFFEVLRERRSIRAFEPRPVEEEKLRKLLEAANSAPSAGNLQAYELYLVRDAQRRMALPRTALDQKFIAAAPVVLVFCAHPARAAAHYGARGERLYAIQDATIACTYAMLAATALGLATVWVGAFDDEAVRKVIGAREGEIPVAILPVGYAAETPHPTPRRRLKDLVREV